MDKFKITEPVQPRTKKKSSLGPAQQPDSHGKITSTIGTGEVAKDSIVYLVIRWSFISGSIITILVICNNWFFRDVEKVPELTNDIKVVWNIIIPIITLALGYAFGKSRK